MNQLVETSKEIVNENEKNINNSYEDNIIKVQDPSSPEKNPKKSEKIVF